MLVRLDVKEGVAKAAPILIGTKDSNLYVQGAVDLGEEKLDLTTRTYAKDFSIGAAATPIFLKGTFAEPKIDVEKKALAARALAAAGLAAAVGPVGALVPFVELGLGKEGKCAEYTTSIRKIEKAAAH